jgi:hypothetical protein
MKSNVFGFALLSVTAIVASAPAQAQNGSLTRSFVSSSGIDTNPCTITQPCATFAQAYTKVGTNGIVAALDPGKYGPLTITGPVTINGNGWAAITGPAGGAITITAPTGNVTLVGLEFDGANTGNQGIYLTSTLTGDATLTIRDCVISNFVDSGIGIVPTAAAGEVLTVFISNTFSLNNGLNGIKIAPAGGAIILGTIAGSTVANNSNNGIDIEGTSGISIVSAIANNNGLYGIYESPVNLAGVVRDSLSTYNNVDFYAVTSTGATYLYHNTFGSFNGNSATLYSDGTNQFSNGAPAGNLPTKQGTY